MTEPVPIKKRKDSDLSYSMIVDAGSPLDVIASPVSSELPIFPRQRNWWVQSDYCANCNVTFSMFVRPHHCRKCGNIFCHTCSQQRTKIPNWIQLPGETKTLKNKLSELFWSNKKVRVCDFCAQNIREIYEFENLMTLVHLLPITIFEYYNLRLVSKDWNRVANFYLSTFREIQYKLSNQVFSKLERFIIKQNCQLFQGHNLLTMAAIKTGDIDTIPINKQQKIVSCKKLMCSRMCEPIITLKNVVCLLKKTRFIEKKKLLDDILAIALKSPRNELDSFLCLFISELVYTCHKEVIIDFLIKLVIQYSDLTVQVYYWLQLNIDKSIYCQKCCEKLYQAVSLENQKQIDDAKFFHTLFQKMPKTDSLSEIRNYFLTHKDEIIGRYIPTRPWLKCVDFLPKKIQIKISKTRPLFVPLECFDTRLNKLFNYYLLYKQEDVRQDSIILKTIRLMDIILKKEMSEKDLKIITYNVLPLTSESGLIEIIPNCKTLAQVNEKFTLCNYILDHNPGETSLQIRQKFIHSCSAYSTITFLLGVGDRHLDNIMISPNGYLFHIDYGFILGKDPKPIGVPKMRITQDMVDAMGGKDSKGFKSFIKLSQDIHHILNKQLPMFHTLLLELCDITGIDEELLTNELLNRFMYGESYEIAKNKLSVHVKSSVNEQTQIVFDFLHYHNKNKTLDNLFSSTLAWIGELFN